MKKVHFILPVLLLAAILATPRFAGLDKFVSLDEPFWIREGANFYYALGQRQFENTIYEYHPGVTTMWFVAGGMLAYFPEYRSLQEGYLKRTKFDLLLTKYGKTDLGLLFYSRLVQEISVVILLLAMFFLLCYLFGSRTAFFTTALVSLSPFFLGHSRLLNHEAIMGLFILISLMSLTVYLFKKRNVLLLIVSATAGALAQLTKSTSLLLFPVVGLIFIFQLAQSRQEFSRNAILSALKTLIFWLALLVAAYFLFWPGMWVAPGKMINEVYGNALSYAFQGSRISVTGGLTPSHFTLNLGEGALEQAGSFVLQLLWHTTPLSWTGFILGILVLFFRQNEPEKYLYQWMTLYLLIMGVLFVVMFSVARGRQSPHYILTGYICVDTIAGLGWSYMLGLLADKWPEKVRSWIMAGILTGLIAFQMVTILGSYPYYYTYLNPLMEVAPASAKSPIDDAPSYGEGLDQAAAYLSQKPAASKMTVMSYCGYGCFAFLFPGTTLTINDLSLVNPDPTLIDYLRASDYVVLDHHLQKIQNDLAGFEGLTPEKIIWINGIEYFDIYRAADLLQRVNANLH